MSRTPLAWKNLTADWRRLLLASLGVGFAVVLMFMQNGFRNALLDSPVQLIRALQADLIAVSTARYSLPSEQRFHRDLLNLATRDPDVQRVLPMYVERARAQIRVVGEPRRPIRVIAMPLAPDVFSDQSIQQQLPRLRAPNAALLDRRTRSQFGFAVNDPKRLAAQTIELLDRSVQVIGTIQVGTDFAHDGTILISESSFAKYFPFRGSGEPLSVVDLGLIRLRPAADPQLVAERLTELSPREWLVLPREQLIKREIAFWGEQTPIGMIFLVGALMGFAVGVIICYQILFTSIHDSMAEFATLKAMGYPNSFFVRLIIRQSVYLSLLGFLPALLLSWGLFQLLQSQVGLPMLMTFPRIGLVLGLTLTMCFLSGLIALRKLLRADPASLF